MSGDDPDRPALPGGYATIAELPLFPLGTVLFPDGLLELKVFEARYLDLMAHCMREGAPFGVVALQSGAEVGADAVVELHRAGTLAEVMEADSPGAGILEVRCRGTRRFRLDASRQRDDGLWVAEATPVASDPSMPPAPRHQALVQSLVEAVDALAAQGSHPFLAPHRFDDAGWVANRWSEILPLPVEVRQQLMGLLDPLARLDVVEQLLALARRKPEPPSPT